MGLRSVESGGGVAAIMLRGKCPKNGDTSRVNIARDCIIGAELPFLFAYSGSEFAMGG